MDGGVDCTALATGSQVNRRQTVRELPQLLYRTRHHFIYAAGRPGRARLWRFGRQAVQEESDSGALARWQAGKTARLLHFATLAGQEELDSGTLPCWQAGQSQTLALCQAGRPGRARSRRSARAGSARLAGREGQTLALCPPALARSTCAFVPRLALARPGCVRAPLARWVPEGVVGLVPIHPSQRAVSGMAARGWAGRAPGSERLALAAPAPGNYSASYLTLYMYMHIQLSCTPLRTRPPLLIP